MLIACIDNMPDKAETAVRKRADLVWVRLMEHLHFLPDKYSKRFRIITEFADEELEAELRRMLRQTPIPLITWPYAARDEDDPHDLSKAKLRSTLRVNVNAMSSSDRSDWLNPTIRLPHKRRSEVDLQTVSRPARTVSLTDVLRQRIVVPALGGLR